MSENNVKWHPYPQEKPNEDGFYLVTMGLLGNYVRILRYSANDMWKINSKLITDHDVIAWTELPMSFGVGKNSNLEVKWHSYPDNMPDVFGEYLVTKIIDNKRSVAKSTWYPTIDMFSAENNEVTVIAWSELPKPYKGE